MQKTEVVIQTDNEELKTEQLSLFEEQIYETINLAKGTNERKTLLLSALLQDHEFENLLRQHYYDILGSEGFIQVTTEKLKTILGGVIEFANEHIEVEVTGYNEYDTYVDYNDDEKETQLNWIKTVLK